MSIPPYEPPKAPFPGGVGNTLLCPKCAGVMKTYERNGIHLEQCDSCRGIFLDFGELESLTQMENRFMQAAPQQAPPQQGYGQDYGAGSESAGAGFSTAGRYRRGRGRRPSATSPRMTAVASAMTQKGALAKTFSSSMKTPNSRNNAAAPIWMSRSGRCLPATAPTMIASPSATTMPSVDPIQTPSQLLSAASVMVAS